MAIEPDQRSNKGQKNAAINNFALETTNEDNQSDGDGSEDVQTSNSNSENAIKFYIYKQ